MAETVRVLVEEEEVDKRIRDLGEQISKDYEGRSASHLCIKRWRILYVRTGKENYRAGVHGLYECQQLW